MINYPFPELKKVLLSMVLGLGFLHSSYAQSDSNRNQLKVSGYIETYYGYDFGNPADHKRPDFLYSFNRHNEVNINLGFVQAAYNNNKVRGKLALMTGTYANANLATEPGVLKNIFEANAGVKISKTKNLWVDAGVFASHIGFESAISADCWNMTRSILAENSPYYLSGAKVSYTSDHSKWFISGLILNGWQRIQRMPGNQTPAFGHQLCWTPNPNIKVNSSSFIGSNTPDSTRRMRYFHNLYSQFQWSKNLGIILGFDMGIQQKKKGSRAYQSWFSHVIIAQFSPAEKWAVSARAEYYSDRGEIIIVTGTPNGFQTFAYSINLDVKVMENVLWRIEGRTFKSRTDNIFMDRNLVPGQYNYFAGTSLSIAL